MTVKFIISDTETVGLNPPPAPASGVVEVAYLELDMNTLEFWMKATAAFSLGA